MLCRPECPDVGVTQVVTENDNEVRLTSRHRRLCKPNDHQNQRNKKTGYGGRSFHVQDRFVFLFWNGQLFLEEPVVYPQVGKDTNSADLLISLPASPSVWNQAIALQPFPDPHQELASWDGYLAYY